MNEVMMSLTNTWGALAIYWLFWAIFRAVEGDEFWFWRLILAHLFAIGAAIIYCLRLVLSKLEATT